MQTDNRTAVAGTDPPMLRCPTYGELLARLSALQRQGHAAGVDALRDRLRAAVRERSLEEVRAEMLAVQRALETLECRS